MRHALVTTHLMTQARAAIAQADELQEHQAHWWTLPADPTGWGEGR